MRFSPKRDLAGEWGIWDVRNQCYYATGLGSEASEAKERCDELNAENTKAVQEFLADPKHTKLREVKPHVFTGQMRLFGD